MSSALKRPPTLPRIVASKLREEIFLGILKPGQQLSEPDLSARYGVSRGTIREGLLQAGSDGLVEVLQHRGARVTSLTSRLVHETYSLRRLLETYAVQEAWKARAYSQEILDSLEAALAHIEDAQRSGNWYDQVAADYDFHWALCSASQHSLLLRALREPQWLTRLCMVGIKSLVPALTADARQHLPILEGLRVGLSAVLEALDYHLRETERILVERMCTLPEGDPAPAGGKGADHPSEEERKALRGLEWACTPRTGLTSRSRRHVD